MAKQVINVGTATNDSTGDSLRVGATKINNNFTELYNALGGETGAPLSIVSKILAGNGIIVSSPQGDVLVTSQTASNTQLGGIKIGTGISINEQGVASVEVYSLPKASQTILGGVKVGENLTIDGNGVLSANTAISYSLPTASPSTKGGIKIGEGLEVVDDVLNVMPQQLDPASAESNGVVRIGSGLVVDETGLLSTEQAGPAILISELKEIVASCDNFDDFKSAIAAL